MSIDRFGKDKEKFDKLQQIIDEKKSMQGALIAQGYPCGSYGADGICGAATVSAIRAFQTANGLTADGICGQDTWGALLRK